VSAKHTPGPWFVGTFYEAFVNDGSHKGWTNPQIPENECAFCGNKAGVLVSSYVAEDGGTSHRHRFPVDSFHDITSESGIQIVGNYDYEEGGICTSKEDAHLIAAAPTMYEALESAYAEAVERDEDLGANCWPQVTAALRKARGE